MNTLDVILRSRLSQAIKNKNDREKNIIRFVVSEIERVFANEINSQVKIVKKVMESNSEVILQLDDRDPRKEVLIWENNYLAELMPKSLGKDEIKSLLVEIMDAIATAKNSGQATGIAMKFLKSKTNKPVSGDDVSSIVQELRS